MAEMLVDTSNQDKDFDRLLFDESKNIDADQDYWFQLRGGSINTLIDVATPLIGMVLRTRKLSSCDNVDKVYQQTVEEIKAIEVELQEQQYDHAVILAYRYVLCAFIDEAVMSTPWGADTVWAEHSLLTRFHNETWGGEKVFTILSRLEAEPERYRPLLEFIFLCLSLGFEGRYRVMDKGREEYEKVITQLHLMLKRLNEQTPTALTQATEHVVSTRYRLRRQLPVWTVFAGFLSIVVAAFISYSVILNAKSASVLEQLHQMLQ